MPQSNKPIETPFRTPPRPTGAAEPSRHEDDSPTEPSVSKPGGFANDPDDPKNPNEAIERHRRKLRP